MDSTLPHSPLKWTFWMNLVFKNKIFLPTPCPSELHPNLEMLCWEISSHVLFVTSSQCPGPFIFPSSCLQTSPGINIKKPRMKKQMLQINQRKSKTKYSMMKGTRVFHQWLYLIKKYRCLKNLRHKYYIGIQATSIWVQISYQFQLESSIIYYDDSLRQTAKSRDSISRKLLFC